MILIPEIETVVILVPRTGSGSLKQAILHKYPRALPIYRHMEADGVPLGYDRWRRVGVVRDPVERLWSLYKFCRDMAKERHGIYHAPYMNALRDSTRGGFNDWIVNNQVVFTNGYDVASDKLFWPGYMVRHSLPETRKSQWIYLRPDLGTAVYDYPRLSELANDLGLTTEDSDGLGRKNVTARINADSCRPALSPAARAHIEAFFSWDLRAC